MRRFSTTGPAMDPAFLWTVLPGKHSALAVILLLVVVAAPRALAQCVDCGSSPAADILGPHSGAGRGCGSCHASHSPSPGSERGGAAETGVALWGEDGSPYGSTVLFGDPGNYVEVQPSRVSSADHEVMGILLCLSCHDGNLTPQNMMPIQSYVHRMGFLRNTPVGRQAIPTLTDESSASISYRFEHPLGADATIRLDDGLVFTNGVFSVVPGSPYARFAANYGLPSLATGGQSLAFGVNSTGQPYVLCTTCHNQHMTAYQSTGASPIGGDGGGRPYTTYFFANGPYNPQLQVVSSALAPSAAQFCRQCHLDLANEGNNSYNIRTAFY